MFRRIFTGIFLTGHVLISCLFIVMSFFQYFAILDGFEVWLELHWIIAAPLALITAGIPIVGTIFGMCGAVHAWDWSWWSAFFLFCGPFIVVFIVVGIITLLEN